MLQVFHNQWNNDPILELGSGCGLTSIAASIFSESEIICTDMCDSILTLIKSNIDLNKNLINPRASIKVLELDFKKITTFSAELTKGIAEAKVILAADGNYNFFIFFFLNIG